MPAHRHTTIAGWWKAFFVFFLFGQVALQSFVLCQGDDGHVALEVAAAADSCETPVLGFAAGGGRGQSLSATHLRYGHCGTCRDVAVTQTDGSYVRPPAVVEPVALSPVLLPLDSALPLELSALAPTAPEHAASTRFSGLLAERHPVLRALRSTVLLV